MLSTGPYNYNRFNLFEKKSKPDFLDMDKDGDKKESMKKAIKEKGGCSKCEGDCECDDKKDVKENREMAYGGGKPGKGSGDGSKPKPIITGGKTYTMKGKDGKPLFSKEEVEITKEDVISHLIENNYVNNEVSAEVMFKHISDEFLEEIESSISEGFMPLPKEKMARQANKAYGKEQQAVKSGDEAGANKQMQRRIAMTDPKGRKAVIGK